MVVRFFWIVILLEIIEIAAVLLLGSVFGYARIFALLALLSLSGLVLLRLSPKLTAPRRGKHSSPDERILFNFGALLITVPGFLSTLAGIPLLFRSGRLFCRRFVAAELVPKLPVPMQIFASYFGLGVPPRSGETAGSSRTWNPYGTTETSQDQVVEDNDPDVATAYNGDLSPERPASDDDEIIDVDYTQR